MNKPGKSLKSLCKRLKVRLTVKRGKKRVYKSVKVLKAQCAKKRKVGKKKRRRRKFGMERYQDRDLNPDDVNYDVITPSRTPSRTPLSNQRSVLPTPGGTPNIPGTPLNNSSSFVSDILGSPSQNSSFLSYVSSIENDSPQQIQDEYFSEYDDVLNSGVRRNIFGDEKKDDGFGDANVHPTDKGIFTNKLLNINNNNNTKEIGLSKAAKKATKKLSKEEILSIVAITIGIGGLTTGILGLQNKLK
tara:strand:- start:128 stop:862 length:735 start_codon:yes stop_codon:yes gene_type:complete